MINILIAEDHQMIREALTFFLNQDRQFHVIGTCSNAADAVSMSLSLQPDIVLMDINMKPFSGMEATRQILLESPQIRIIALTMYDNVEFLHKMFRMGARGYLTKNISAEEMRKGIREVYAGNIYICAEMRELLASHPNASERFANFERLSEREKEIIHHVRLGKSTRDISEELNLSYHTVDAHRYNIMKKLKVKNTPALINLIKDFC